MTSRQKDLEFAAFVRKRAPKERTVGAGKPGRRFRREAPNREHGVSTKEHARTTDEGRAWLARKAAGR